MAKRILTKGNLKEMEGNPENIVLEEQTLLTEMPYERYDYFYSRKADIMREIDETAVYLKWSAYENENRWHTFYQYVWPNYEFWGSYYNEVQSVKEWLNSRMDWLKVEFDKM
jgi:hypothetical protein